MLMRQLRLGVRDGSWLTIMLFMLLQRIAREPTRRVPHSPKLQSHLRLHSILQHQLLSFAHYRRRIQARLDFARLLQLLFQRALLVKAAPMFLQATCHAGTATSQVTGQGSVLILRRITTKVSVRGRGTIVILLIFLQER